MSTLLKKIAVATLIVSIAPAIATAKVSSLLDYVTGNMNQQQNQFCAGYTKGKTCDDVTEKTETCPQSYKYKKCISKSPREICLYLKYIENPKCEDNEELEVCHHNKKIYEGFGKCVHLSPEEMCKKEDEDFTKNPTCNAFQDKKVCEHDPNYSKCVDTAYDDWCRKHRYTDTSCTGIYEVDKPCPHPGRTSNQSELMRCKLRSASEMCPGYSTSPDCNLAWQVEVPCTVDGYSNYKKCEPSEAAKRCKNNGYTRLKPVVCPSGQKPEDCPYLPDVFAKCVDKTAAEKCLEDEYQQGIVCNRYEEIISCEHDNNYIRCELTDYDTWCHANGYTKRDCSIMETVESCPHPGALMGVKTLKICTPIEPEEWEDPSGIDPVWLCEDEGYVNPKLTTCPAYQKLKDCPYSPDTHNKCVDMTAAEKCLEDQYQQGITSCPTGKLKDCPYLATYKKCVPAEVITCVEGAVLYKDLKCYDALPNKEAIGVVFDTTNKLAVSLTQANKKFGPDQDYQSLENLADKNKVKQEVGKTNTDKIVKTEGQTSTGYAAGYCYSLAPEGKWYLPGYSELKKIGDNFDNINAYLESAGGTKFGDGQTAAGSYWLPVESTINTSMKMYYAWTYAPSPKILESASLKDYSKNQSTVIARCVISYDSNQYNGQQQPPNSNQTR